MAQELIEQPRLASVLAGICEQVTAERDTSGYILQALFNTGLRVSEVLDVWRWSVMPNGDYEVQLSKREGKRIIQASSIPVQLAPHYENQLPFRFETYSSINNTFKYYAPGLTFGKVARPTRCHAFRYNYIKQLYANGLTVTEIAAHIGHKVEANTAGYILAAIKLGY